MAIMERLRKYIPGESRAEYEPLEGGSIGPDGDQIQNGLAEEQESFSWLEYGIFLLLGIAMLWAWNMFLAAAPYFHGRFEGNQWIQSHFQSAIISVSTVTNLGSVLTLTKMQTKGLSYAKRIALSLLINIVIFTLLALSTKVFDSVSPGGYFGFLLVMVAGTSLSTGLSQNGVFAYTAGFGREEYTQAIMTGQAVAGVLPCIVQIISVLSVPPRPPDNESSSRPGHHPPHDGSSTSAFSYFLTATGISLVTLLAFSHLARLHALKQQKSHVESPSHSPSRSKAVKTVPLSTLFRKLRHLAPAVFLTFGITMVFSVFTQQIISVHDPPRPQILDPPVFIPLAFLLWNTGDLIGRLLTAFPEVSLTQRPWILFLLAICRVVFIPLYLLCNIRGRGAVVPSDTFYLVVVELLFGITNGYLGSGCMMGAAEWVDVEEREAAGGFMGLSLVAGLTVGSLLSFFAAGARGPPPHPSPHGHGKLI